MTKRAKRILITGASGTLGGAIARRVAGPGSEVALQYRSSKEKALALEGELKSFGASAFVVEADLGKADEAALLARECSERMGGVDLLVHAAASFERTPLGSVTEEQWDAVMNLDLKGAFFLAQELSLIMQREGGRMIFISDVAAEKPYAGYLPYCIAKAGIDSLVKGLAKSLAPKIQVNGVAPYLVTRPVWLSDKGWADLLLRMPMRKASTPEEVAAVVSMLAESGESITGQIIAIDGGRLLR